MFSKVTKMSPLLITPGIIVALLVAIYFGVPISSIKDVVETATTVTEEIHDEELTDTDPLQDGLPLGSRTEVLQPSAPPSQDP
jgi:hypothetical protein